MHRYCVNKRAQDNGDHEVHRDDCQYLPAPENQLWLGYFSNCHDAVKEAKKHYKQSNGCAYCSPECHTG